jgi:hypothetical protein
MAPPLLDPVELKNEHPLISIEFPEKLKIPHKTNSQS